MANEYQVAVSDSPDTVHRKWRCLGSFRAPSHLSAAYAATPYTGTIDSTPVVRRGGAVFKLSNNSFVRVGFGT